MLRPGGQLLVTGTACAEAGELPAVPAAARRFWALVKGRDCRYPETGDVSDGGRFVCTNDFSGLRSAAGRAGLSVRRVIEDGPHFAALFAK
jgi:hypothetical protein